MKIETSRFGTLEVAESEVIEFKSPILGFEHFRRFVLLRHGGEKESAGSPFYWLQSVEEGMLAFVAVPATAIKPDYRPMIHEKDLSLLELKSEEELVLMVLATVRVRPSDPMRITANLRAPLLINTERRWAIQTVLEDAEFPIQYEVSEQHQSADKLSFAIPAVPRP